MKDLRNEIDIKYEKEAENLGSIAFWIYLLSLPYVFIIAMSTNIMIFRDGDQSPWGELWFNVILTNLTLSTFVLSLFLLVVYHLKQQSKKTLLMAVLPVIAFLLTVDLDSILNLIF